MFAGYLVKQKTSIKNKSDAHIYLKWTINIIKKLDKPEFKKPVLKLLEVVGQCLDILLKFKSITNNVKKTLFKMMIEGREERILDVIVESESHGFAQVILEYAKKDDNIMKSVKEKIMKMFCEKILTSKVFMGTEIMNAYKTLMEIMTQQDLNEVILPVLIRSCKRNTEAGLGKLK